MADGDAEMAFAQDDVADEDDVGFVLDEAQTEQVLNLGPVDFLRPGPVELVECFDHREAGQPDSALDAAIFAPVGLALDQARQIIHMGPLFGTGLLSQGVEVL